MLHLIKLCVGVESPEILSTHIRQQLAGTREKRPHIGVVTRMTPGRAPELLDGGSLYWVMKGQVKARQQIGAIRKFVGTDGVTRCWIGLEPEVVLTSWAAYRPFQGWRYLDPDKAPSDAGAGNEEMPAALQQELASMGLL